MHAATNLRKPWRAALALATVATLTSGGLALAAAALAAAAGSAFPAHYAAPYLQIDSSDAGDMAADESATGLKYYTLAFLTPQSGCTPEWEDDVSVPVGFCTEVVGPGQNPSQTVITGGGIYYPDVADQQRQRRRRRPVAVAGGPRKPGTVGWTADTAASGLGVYCYFDVNPGEVSANALTSPTSSGVDWHDMVTVSLGGTGTIEHIINGTGGTVDSGATQADLTSYS